MTRFGIETLNYGPSSGPRDAEGEKVAIRNFREHHKNLRAGRRRNLRRPVLELFIEAVWPRI